MTTTSDAPQRRRWTRFGLRSLLVAMCVSCLILATWSVYVKPFRDQAMAVKVVNDLRGNVEATGAAGPPWQRWLVTTALGPDSWVRVTSVDVRSTAADDTALVAMSAMTHLQSITLDHTKITDQGMAALARMKELRTLSLRYAKITDAGIGVLPQLPALETLYLTGTKVSDAAAGDLGQLRSLRRLFIRWTGISPTAAASKSPNGSTVRSSKTSPTTGWCTS